jgi:multidrug resistance efflux pump
MRAVIRWRPAGAAFSPSVTFARAQGTVSGISMGITDQDNKDGPGLLSSVNPTFTWVRLAQRIPLRVHITHVPPDVLISAGMTCTVVIKEGAAPEIGRGLKKVMTAIFGTPST